MSQLICCTSQVPVGCTFLDWSINFLAGQNKFFNYKLGWHDLTHDPITKATAHGHRKNHPNGFAETQRCVEQLQQHTDFASLYPTLQHLNQLAAEHGLSLSGISQSDWEHLYKLWYQDYCDSLHWLAAQGAKIIYVELNKSLPLYLIQTRSNYNLMTGRDAVDADEIRHGTDLMFFNANVNKWDNPTTTWDWRERLALNQRPFSYEPQNIDLSFQHLWLDSQELWFNGRNKMLDILAWLEIPITQSRLPQWYKMFDQWQHLQFQAVEFQFQYQHIVNAIVNNWNYAIDLTFDQEVVIQHCLIYQHNLNLKTWQLEKFPKNTKDLHQLLEPNIHQVPQIYS